MTHFRSDRNKSDVGFIFYVKEDIPCNLVNSFSVSGEKDIIPLEFSTSNMKWLLLSLCKPPLVYNATLLDQIKLSLNNYGKSYENFILLGDFNMTIKAQI